MYDLVNGDICDCEFFIDGCKWKGVFYLDFSKISSWKEFEFVL